MIENTEITARLIALKYYSSITAASFRCGAEKFTLFGDRRMTSPLTDYLGEEIILYIENEYTWSWHSLDENFIEE
jgi:hypothetical protein